MFSVGQKVVCIDDSGWADYIIRHDVTVPRKGVVYTIRDIVEGYCTKEGFGPGLLLSEIRNPIAPIFDTEYNFKPRRFRPIVERKTSIEIFKKMLSPTKETV